MINLIVSNFDDFENFQIPELCEEGEHCACDGSLTGDFPGNIVPGPAFFSRYDQESSKISVDPIHSIPSESSTGMIYFGMESISMR